MKIYTVRASQKVLKYYEEQVHYTLDGSEEYDWRSIQKQIKNLEEISAMPQNLSFISDQVDFKEINEFSWLKSDFRLPILHNEFVELVTRGDTFRCAKFPIRIVNKHDQDQVNSNFSALYIQAYFDCVDKELSPTVRYGEQEFYDYRTATFKDDLDYPPLFKVKDISTPYMHFVNDIYYKLYKSLNLRGMDMQETGKGK